MSNHRKAAALWLTVPFWFFALPCAWAADSLKYQEPMAAPPSMGGMLLRMVISLLIVIGLALVLVKFLQKNTQLTKQSSWARVLDQCIIGQNQRLVLVEMFGKVYVLGVTEHNIAAILEEKDIDLSQVKELQEIENDQMNMTSLFGGNFLEVLDGKIGSLKKYYSRSGKSGKDE